MLLCKVVILNKCLLIIDIGKLSFIVVRQLTDVWQLKNQAIILLINFVSVSKFLTAAK